jgi:hypothetical protein
MDGRSAVTNLKVNYSEFSTQPEHRIGDNRLSRVAPSRRL